MRKKVSRQRKKTKGISELEGKKVLFGSQIICLYSIMYVQKPNGNAKRGYLTQFYAWESSSSII